MIGRVVLASAVALLGGCSWSGPYWGLELFPAASVDPDCAREVLSEVVPESKPSISKSELKRWIGADKTRHLIRGNVVKEGSFTAWYGVILLEKVSGGGFNAAVGVNLRGKSSGGRYQEDELVEFRERGPAAMATVRKIADSLVAKCGIQEEVSRRRTHCSMNFCDL